MRFGLRLLLVLLLFPCVLSAQVEEVLRRDSKITVGDLPNGTSYYIVSNPTTKGYADFSLVQKGYVDRNRSKSALSEVEIFSGKGVGYSKDGYISYKDGSTVFSFQDVPVFDESASDSTLLALFNLMKSCPSKQAVIISGDVAVAKIMDRLYMLSMTIGRLSPAPAVDSYQWNPVQEPSVQVNYSSKFDFAKIIVSWSMPRTPVDMMGTLQPLVSEMLSDEMATLIKTRVRTSFEEAGVPMARMTSRRIDSSMTAGDESFEFTVTTSISDALKATSILAHVFSVLDSKGASAAEYQDAKDKRISQTQKEAGELFKTNRYYVGRCVSSYLYGSSLASSSAVASFFSKRRLSSDKELFLFNNYMSSILDPARGLSLTLATSDRTVGKDEFLRAFEQEWVSAEGDTTEAGFRISYGDTLSLITPKSKIKIKTSAPEPLSGGVLWTFSNGMRVVFKNTGQGGQFEYGMLFRGGVTAVPGIRKGEAPFVADMLRISSVAGMKNNAFRSMLRANGIEMTPEASLSDLRITGSAPKDKLELLMKALVAVSAAKPADAAAFEVYRRDEAIRSSLVKHSTEGVLAVVDSLVSPKFKYSFNKDIRNLRPDLPARAGKYFDIQFSKCQDGILVITGDFDEYYLQKVLSRYLGGFKTSKTIAVRPHVARSLRTGWGTVYDLAGESSVGDGEPVLVMNIPVITPVSTDSYMTFKIAEEVVRRSVVKAVAPLGMRVSVTTQVECFPSEMMSLRVICRPCREEGLPMGVSSRSIQRARDAVRYAVQSAPNVRVDLSGYKTAMKNRIASNLSTPEGIVWMVLFRYSNNKDIISRYAKSLDEVKKEDVVELLNTLASSKVKAEYIQY